MDSTRLWVIIPTFGRPAVLDTLLSHLEHQQRLPDHVVVSAPDATHLPEERARNYPVSVVLGGMGISSQRNRGLEAATPRSDVITFFDDDFFPADSYLSQVEGCFAAHDDIAVVMGHAVVDGARGSGLTCEEGLQILRAAEASAPAGEGFEDQPGAYGCNMSIRTDRIGAIRFDERLVLYGWQEDIDFTGQLRRHGRVTKMTSLFGVHLGIKSGRISGVKLGYSQVVNPAYLILKGTIPPRFALNLVARNIGANLLRSLWSEPHVDRPGRLKGNMIAAWHLAQGRIEPEYVLKLLP